MPSKWIQRYGVKKGDELEIEEKLGKLVISNNGLTDYKENYSVNFEKFSNLTAKCAMDVIYKAGYDETEINYPDEKMLSAIQQRLPLLIGFEITDQGDKRCVVRDITRGVTDTEFEPMLRRVFLITLSMAKSGLEHMEQGRCAELDKLSIMEEQNNSLVNYCQRILTKHNFKETKKQNFYYVVLWYLEGIGDDLRDLFKIASSRRTSSGKPVRAEIVGLFKDVVKYFNKFYEVFYKYDKDVHDQLMIGKNELLAKGDEIKALNKDESAMIRCICNIPQRIYDVLPTLTILAPQHERSLNGYFKQTQNG